MVIRVLITAGAGGRTAEQDRETVARVTALFQDARPDVRPDVLLVSGRELSTIMRSAGVASGADLVVVGGGDGSVSTAAAVTVETGTPLGVLPLGTLNHFARDLGIPLRLEEAVDVIMRGHVRLVDVGEVNGKIFINNSSIGLYPSAVEHRNHQRVRFGWPKWAATLHAAISAVRRFQPVHVTVRVDDHTRGLTTPFVFVGNNAYDMSLFSIGTRRCLDDGVLSVYFAETSTALGLARLVFHALTGRLDQAREFESFSASDLEIHTSRPTLLVARDGEVDRMKPPLQYRTRPRALRVLAPPPSP